MEALKSNNRISNGGPESWLPEAWGGSRNTYPTPLLFIRSEWFSQDSRRLSREGIISVFSPLEVPVNVTHLLGPGSGYE